MILNQRREKVYNSDLFLELSSEIRYSILCLLEKENLKQSQVAKKLGEQGIFVWDGHYYAIEVMRRLELLESGGLIRIGFVHYNTIEEVNRVLAALQDISNRPTN